MRQRNKIASSAATATAHAGPSSPPVAIDVPDDGTPSPADASTPHAVENLAVTFGATPDEVALVTEGMSAEAIRAAAEESATPRMADEAYRVGDAARLFFAAAPPATISSLRMQPVVVRVMVSCAAQASASWRQARREATQRRGTSSASDVTHEHDLQRARVARDQLAEALRGLHSGDPVTLERIRDAEQPGRLGHVDAGPGRALTSLVALGREALGDDALRARAELWGIESAWLDQCARLAVPAMDATAAQLTPATPTVSGATEMHARGLAMILLRRVLGAFAAGNAAHLGVPAIEALYLRSVFNPRRSPGRKGDDVSKAVKGKRTKAEAEKNDPVSPSPAPAAPKAAEEAPKP